jgi:hypothetical protein
MENSHVPIYATSYVQDWSVIYNNAVRLLRCEIGLFLSWEKQLITGGINWYMTILHICIICLIVVTQRSYVYNISSVKDSRWFQPSFELKDYDKRDDDSF